MRNEIAQTPSETGHRCLACGRRLTVSTNYGPKCARKIRQALAALAATGEYTKAQADSAAELFEDGGMVPVRETAKNGTLFHAVSTDGDEVHPVVVKHCGCPAGKRGKTGCYHRMLARAFRSAMAHAATATRNDYAKAA